MSPSEKILCCRISWMPTYTSIEEKPFSYHRYILEENTPYEALNFLRGDDGYFRGYVPVGSDAAGKYGKINIARLGATKGANKITGVTTIFCAPHENEGGLRIVGFYRNAMVLRDPEISESADRVPVARIISDDAVLIPELERIFEIPGRGEGGFGQSSLWYGLNDEENPLRKQVLRYVADQSELPKDQPAVIDYRRRRVHERWEGRGSSRGFIHRKGFRCEACNYSISNEDQAIWGSGFELHHLVPWAQMDEGAQHSLSEKDFAVLCAVCHRAIHRTKNVSDIAEFRRKHPPRRARET